MGLGNPMPGKYPKKRYISVISQEDTQICLALDGAAIFQTIYYTDILKDVYKCERPVESCLPTTDVITDQQNINHYALL